MRKIICECEVCNAEKVFLEGDIEQGFGKLNLDSLGSIFVCDDCEINITTLKSHKKTKLKNNLLRSIKEELFPKMNKEE